MDTQFTSGIAEAADGYRAGSEAALQAVDALDTESTDFCQVFCSSHVDYADAIAGVRSVIGDQPELIGCASTGEFTETMRAEAGVALALVASDNIEFQVGIGTGLGESTQRALRDARNGISESHDHLPYRSAVVLYDGFATDGEQLAQQVRRKLGARVPFSGGAASDNYEQSSTPVFCNDRIEEDAVVIAVIDSETPSYVISNHGHEPISEPLDVTSATGSVIEELDGRPALDVWRELIAPYAREMFGIDIETVESGTPTMLRMNGVFELGIDQGEAYKIRGCVDTDDDAGTMSCLVAIPEGTQVQLMRGTVDSQIESARTAARTAHELADGEYAGGFIYDCACRHIILGEEFEAAVEAMGDELDGPFVGFETYGEMSMNHGEMSGFHNSTTVISLLPK